MVGFAASIFLSLLSLNDPYTIELAILSIAFCSDFASATGPVLRTEEIIGYDGADVMKDEGAASF